MSKEKRRCPNCRRMRTEWALNGDCTKCSLKELFASYRPPACPHPAGWPLTCPTLGVHPDQVPEAIEKDKKYGVRADYDSDGNPVFTGPGDMKRYAEAYGYYDRNGGYGSAQKQSSSGSRQTAEAPDIYDFGEE